MHPVLLQAGPITVYAYGTLIFLGIVAGLLVGRAELRRLGIDPGHASDCTLLGIFCGLLGGKVVYLLTVPWDTVARDPWRHLSPRTGLVWYGVVAAVVTSTALLTRHRRLPVLRVLDAGFLALALGQALGRIGCFLAGCCHGTACDLPWAVVFRDPRSAAPLGVALHPTQLYLAAHAFLVFAILFGLRRRKRHDGDLCAAFALTYAAGRFFLEELRGDASRGAVGGLSTSQTLSVAAFMIGLGLLVWLRRGGSTRLPPRAPMSRRQRNGELDPTAKRRYRCGRLRFIARTRRWRRGAAAGEPAADKR